MKVVAIFMAVLLLGGCASNSKQAQDELGACSSDQKVVVSDHISSQIDAIEKLDFKKAYTYAAQSFQDSVTLDQFERVITRQYQMLISNDGYNFGKCLTQGGYLIQQVRVKTSRESFELVYKLSLVNKRLGVVAATINQSSAILNT